MSEAARQQQPTTEPARAAAPAPPRDRWTQWVALTTTILAVCAAISALKGGGYSTRVQLSTTQEANLWSYFQSKSIKQHAVELHREQLEILRAEARTAEAEAMQKNEGDLKRHGAAFGLAIMLLQIAIMLSSVGALIKRPAMWVVGLFFGCIGLGYMANGFWLFL